jgi:hypothetical protein
MKAAVAIVLVVIILLAGITAAGVVGMIIRGEAKEPAAQQAPAMPLVHCHAQGGEVVDGKCVPHRSKK